MGNGSGNRKVGSQQRRPQGASSRRALTVAIAAFVWVACKSPQISQEKPSKPIVTPKDFSASKTVALTFEGESWQPRFSADGARIIFVGHRAEHDNSQVYIMNLATQKDRRITFNDGEDSSPDFSPDMKKIIYASTTDERKEHPDATKSAVAAILEDASVKAEVESTIEADHVKNQNSRGHKNGPSPSPTAGPTPAVSPAATATASASPSTAPSPSNSAPFDPLALLGNVLDNEIYQSGADGNHIERFTHSVGFDGDCRYSRDGKNIVFSSYRDGKFEIYTMNSNGSHQKRLEGSRGFGVQASYSPDGKQLVWISANEDGTSTAITVADRNGRKKKTLTKKKAAYEHPSWSPDGKKIIFSSNRDDEHNFELYLMNADGTCLKRLTYSQGKDTDPVVSPDGTKLVFTSDRNKGRQIYLTDFSEPKDCSVEEP